MKVLFKYEQGLGFYYRDELEYTGDIEQVVSRILYQHITVVGQIT